MSKARLVITAVILEGRTQAEVAKTYGVSKGWVSKLIARYHLEGEAAFEPRSRRPKTSPAALAPATAELILDLRTRLSTAGLDAGADTIAWHLAHHLSYLQRPRTGKDATGILLDPADVSQVSWQRQIHFQPMQYLWRFRSSQTP